MVAHVEMVVMGEVEICWQRFLIDVSGLPAMAEWLGQLTRTPIPRLSARVISSGTAAGSLPRYVVITHGFLAVRRASAISLVLSGERAAGAAGFQCFAMIFTGLTFSSKTSREAIRYVGPCGSLFAS
jgi:hypothetical protein